jgi:hypothetical protein
MCAGEDALLRVGAFIIARRYTYRNRRVSGELSSQTLQCHILGDGIVRNEYVCPRFAIVACGMIRGAAAPFDSPLISQSTRYA